MLFGGKTDANKLFGRVMVSTSCQRRATHRLLSQLTSCLVDRCSTRQRDGSRFSQPDGALRSAGDEPGVSFECRCAVPSSIFSSHPIR
eukprot:3777626-Rhodomonas_salina.2